MAGSALEDKEGAERNMNAAPFAEDPEGEITVGGIG